jgi:hypothetical protein
MENLEGIGIFLKSVKSNIAKLHFIKMFDFSPIIDLPDNSHSDTKEKKVL